MQYDHIKKLTTYDIFYSGIDFALTANKLAALVLLAICLEPLEGFRSPVSAYIMFTVHLNFIVGYWDCYYGVCIEILIRVNIVQQPSH